MCAKEGRPNVMLKENSETKIAAPGAMHMQSETNTALIH